MKSVFLLAFAFVAASATAPVCDEATGLQCAEGIAGCVSDCKTGLEACATCLATDFPNCCPCIKALDTKLKGPPLPFTCPTPSLMTSIVGDTIAVVEKKVEADALCSPCISLTEQGLNILLNEVLNVGVIGGCSDLCGKLKKGADVCNIICDVVGLKGFITALNHTDLDPFYFCEEVDVCAKGSPGAAANIVQVEAAPTSGPAGTVFALEVDFTVENATGVGEIRLAVKGPVDTQVGQGFPVMGYAAGNFGAKISLDTTSTGGQQPVTWSPGFYTYTFELCQGECGSKHPGSKVFGTMGGNFTISDQ